MVSCIGAGATLLSPTYQNEPLVEEIFSLSLFSLSLSMSPGTIGSQLLVDWGRG